MRKRIAAFIGLALLIDVLAASAAQGQTGKSLYPNRPVRMIVPFAAGGPARPCSHQNLTAWATRKGDLNLWAVMAGTTA